MRHEAKTGLRLATSGPAETRSLAAALATILTDGDLLVLTGDLGAGKTCFTQGIGRGLDIDERITSPTFTLANRYRGRLLLHHLDVYRLESLAETTDLGLSELLESGVTVIEWGDRIEAVLPPDHLLVALRYPDPPADHDEPDGLLDTRLIDITIGESPEAQPARRWAERGLHQVVAPWRIGR